ncbi:hypothetical protein ACNKF0_04775 [Nocardioides sp. T5]|uniref:hypothetical protein n=1 Tax=Nocardioides sp. T5 TaxID=3400182 RepID=UPI003A88731F
MTDRPQLIAGALPGAILAAAAAVTGLLRRDKALHPVGRQGTGRLTVTDPAPALGIEALAGAGTRQCRARWSRSMGLPQQWPDIEGLALRLDGAGPDGGDADLLFASTGGRRWNRYVLTLRGRGRFGRLTTLLPARAGGRAVTFRLSPESEPRGGLPPATYSLDLALGTGSWQPVGRIDMAWVEADIADRFDPITHPLAGLEQYAFVTALREPAYVAARAVARARPTTGGHHHA